jgi:hypothetical protein
MLRSRKLTVARASHKGTWITSPDARSADIVLMSVAGGPTGKVPINTT